MDQNAVDERTEIVEDYPLQQVITDEFIAKFEKQAQLYQDKYLPICLKLTNEADWVSHAEGKFYLQCSGAEKICNPLGIYWDRPVVTKHERQDATGAYYEYEVEGVINSRVLRRFGWFTGNCSSRDQFFNARGGYDEGDIRKAAFSNWLVNGVTRIAGIRNPTVEMLRKAGLKPDDIGKIKYGQSKSMEQSAEKISDAQGKRLYAIAKGKGLSDDSIKAYLKTKYSIESTRDILRKDYEAICGYFERGGKENGAPQQEKEPGSDG